MARTHRSLSTYVVLAQTEPNKMRSALLRPRTTPTTKDKAAKFTQTAVTRILIVDDHPATRDGLASRLALEGDLASCGEAADLPGAIQRAEELDPDAIIVDLGLKRGDGLDLVLRLKERGCRAKILVWSWRSEHMYAERALRAGASGYISKDEPTSVIIGALRTVLAGEVYLSPHMMNTIVRRNVAGLDRDTDTDTLNELSNRELEVFQLTGQGFDTVKIAQQLSVSPKTVETYKARIKEKLGLDSGSEMLFRAIRWVIENQK